MKEDLLKIINHYGINNQQRKFWEESGELSEVITQYEQAKRFMSNVIELRLTKEHIAEELSDCFVMLRQFQYYYDISDEEIEDVMKYKIDRQIKRMESDN